VTVQSEATVLDTPAQIGGWYYMSAVSQLTSEIRTKTNYYSKGSVYHGILNNIVKGAIPLPARATRQAKVMMLTALCYDQAPSPVINSARACLAQVAREEGIEFIIG
jgi:hypothetical protein